ncbi:DUF6479 family protein [Streptomyces sp. NPDC005426]|uniref:DUF6479 family protein n=1 Tax=unclassified Streptomyces TaxID=2593676 RepID=UPI0033AA9EBB
MDTKGRHVGWAARTHAGGARRLARVSVGVAAVVLVAGVLRGRRSHTREDRVPTRPRRRTRRWEHFGETGARQADGFGAEGERLTAHDLKGYGNFGTRPAPPGRGDRNEGDDTGGFGSGGPGA